MPATTRANVTELDTQLQLAESIEAYMAVRERADELLGNADDDHLAAAVQVIGAEAAYFVSMLPGVPLEEREGALRVSLVELSHLVAWPFEEGSPGWGGRFAGLAASVARLATRRRPSNPESFDIQMRLLQLVGRLDNAMPPHVELAVPTKRAPDILCDLAMLSCLYGNPRVGLARAELLLANRDRSMGHAIEALVSRLHAAGRLQDPQLRDRTYAALESTINAMRTSFRSRGARLWVANQLERHVSRVLKEWPMYSAPDATDALDLIELVKARLLLDEITARPTALATRDAQQRARELEQALMRFEPSNERMRANAAFAQLPFVSRLPIGSLLPARAAQAANQLRALEAEYADTSAGYGPSATPTRAKELASLLAPDEALIELFIPYETLDPGGEVHIVVVTRDGVLRLVGESPEAPGERMRVAVDGASPLDLGMYTTSVARFRSAILSQDDAATDAGARDLFDWLIAPVLAAGLDPQRHRRWIIVPHSVFHAVPFGALRNAEGKYLIELVSLTTAPSASTWARLVRSGRAGVASAVVVENPSHGDPALRELNEAKLEVERVRKSLAHLRQTHLAGADATEGAVCEALPGKSIVHVVAHGEFPEVDALNVHRIRLAPDATSDGRLHADEIRGLDLTATRLFVLSVCDGSIYRYGPGDEPYGLVPALLAAGVENIVGAQWPVHDELGTELMIELYKHVFRGTIADALQKACLTFINDGIKPVYWAAYTLSGAGRAIGD